MHSPASWLATFAGLRPGRGRFQGLGPGRGSPTLEVRATQLGGVAQLVEHLVCNQGVVGSSPIASTSGLATLN